MNTLLSLSRSIDRLNTIIGKSASWLVLVVVLIATLNALSRKFLHASSNAWLEVQLVLFGAIFLFPAGYALLQNSHVRVDILASRLSNRSRLFIEIFGILFLMAPAAILVLSYSIPMFWSSLQSGERSPNSGGLILWPGKLIVGIGFTLLLLAGLSHLIKCVGALVGACDDPLATSESVEEIAMIEELKAEIEKSKDRSEDV
jgi:TRAP-type mannitol/chloroaromatic compound transport system permease small subunit